MRKLILLLIFCTLIFSCTHSKKPAEILYKNAQIWTVNEKQPKASVLAVANSRFVFVGDYIPENLIDESTRIIDLENKFVLPGFTDSHLHFMDGGFSLSRIDLRYSASKIDFINQIADYAKKLPKGEWILGGNWDHTLWEGKQLPDRSWIDAVTAENPVFINRLDGHMALANSLAINKAGISNDVETPAGGVIVRDKKGRITGVFKESAKYLVSKVIPDAGIEMRIKAAKTASEYLLGLGITSVHDMGYGSHIDAYKKLNEQNELKIRISAYLPIPYWENLAEYGENKKLSEYLSIKGAKGFMDGSLGSSTAKFFKSYLNDQENFGVWDAQMIPPEKMFKRIYSTDSLGFQVVIHAIGTEANNKLLEMYSEISDSKNKRFRIEHAQHLMKEDIPKFAKLGVIASMQPYHCIDDGRWAETKIDYERCKTTYAFRDLLDKDAVVAFGSDWEVAPASPMWGIYAAVTRRTLDHKNPDGWVPEQKISVEEAINCYTINGAIAEFEENNKGSLEVGKLADFVVLSENILNIDPVKIKDVKILQTVVGGETVYKIEY